jgi:hypothetical protein
MKRSFIFSALFILLLAISSCTRNMDKPANKAAKGQWQWEYSDGGVGGYSFQPVNNTLISLSLNSDSTYTFYLNDETQASGRYSIQTTNNTSILHLDSRIQINLLSMQPDQVILEWDSSELQLFDSDISDGFKHHFKKVR